MKSQPVSMKIQPVTIGLTVVAALSAIAIVGCGPGEPRTDAERLARGRQLVEQMSAHLAAAKQVTLTTRETRDVVRASGEKETLSFTDTVSMRRPDRFHAKLTGKKRGLEAWYDGKNVTIAVHQDKVFAQAPMPETIDRTLDAIAERYGYALPVGDLLYSSAAKALLADTTTGGYVGRESVDDVECHHLAFRDTGVDWELWLPVQGDPLPRRLKMIQKARKEKPVADIVFTSWDLAPQFADATFVPNVPAEYEGIAMLQQSAAVKSMPPKTPATVRQP
jgi:hypothetical protein